MLKEKALSVIEKLVERFAEHQKEYHLSDYNEQKTRQDFINPFFKALGWDVDNEKGDSEAYREVIYEDKVVVRGKAKAPDYGFRLSGSGKKRLFYVEAKKPAVSIKTHKESAYQLRRYGSSAQALVSILTNFEDFIVYDCSKVPNLNDSASVARLKQIGFKDYVKEFDFIYDTFSHEAVTKGRFDKFVQSAANKKGTDTLDKRFVESLDQWRKYLATSIAVNNKKITDEELNFAVQQTLDRLIFLRFCEDRSVEPYGQMQTAVAKGDAYKNLLQLFQHADDKYNSGLFDFEKDKITPTIKIDNKVIKTVIEDLYYPKCNFEFSVIPVEILGNAYEQFLGKVIRITPARSVKIEEKPEVRKAGGVYYTPQYIVDYIVKNTVGKLIDGKTPEQVEKIKIVDPACGSGSFLLGAYQYLLDWHLDYYYKEHKQLAAIIEKKTIGVKEKNDAIKKRNAIPLTPDGKLTTKAKKQILVNNIYGVDLDANAAEVSKLSLLLKCMEGETEASIKTITLNLNDRVLPNLDDNIKDGNSLIDTDFYDLEMDFGFDKKIKPFSWKKQFPQVFKNEGFDVVIGNPPYVIVFNDEIKKYLETNFPVFQRNNDLYVAFLSKCLKLVKPSGYFSMITPNSFIRGDYFKNLRQLLNNYRINEIIDFGNKLIFNSANVFTCIFNITNDKPSKSWVMKSDLEEIKSSIKSNSEIYVFKNPIIQKLDNLKKFDDFFLVKDVGYNYWSIGRGKTRGESIGSKILYKGEKENPKDIPYLKGSNFTRYKIDKPTQYLRNNYSKYLNENDTFRFTAEILETNPKLIYRQTSSSLVGTLETNKYHNDKTVHVILPKNGVDIDLKFVLGVFNSKLLNYYYSKSVGEEGRAFAQVKTINVKSLPYVSTSKKQQTEIIKHVDLLLKLNEEIKTEKLPAKIEQIKQRIQHSEDKINQLVYELYELTPEEIEIIENSNNK